MEPLKISLCVYLKNAKRPNASYYARMRKDGRTIDIPLNTKDRGVAESWVRLRRSEIQQYNDYCLVGEEPPDGLLRKLPLNGNSRSHKVSLTLRDAVDSWEKNLRLRGLSERTITMYTKTMGYLFKDMSVQLSSVGVDAIRDAVVGQSHIAASTRHSYFVALVEFIKYCSRYYGMNANLRDEVPKVKVIHKDQPYWTMAEIAKIIDNVNCKTEEQTKCYKAYFWFLALTGARQGEGGSVEWNDIKDGCVTFRAVNVKTGESRTVPLDWRLLDMIAHLPRKSKLIFADIHDAQPSRFNVLAKAVRRSGIHWGGLHSFRRSCSMIMYKKTSDIKGTADMLGHGPDTAIRAYQAARGIGELSELVTQAFGDERLVPDPMDRLIDADLV